MEIVSMLPKKTVDKRAETHKTDADNNGERMRELSQINIHDFLLQTDSYAKSMAKRRVEGHPKSDCLILIAPVRRHPERPICICV